MVGNKIKATLGVLLLAGIALASTPNASAIGVYADVSPTGQSGQLDCTYNSSTDRSVETNWWTITIYVGVTSGPNAGPPLLGGVVVPYLAPSAPTGNTCGSNSGPDLDDLFDGSGSLLPELSQI